MGKLMGIRREKMRKKVCFTVVACTQALRRRMGSLLVVGFMSIMVRLSLVLKGLGETFGGKKSRREGSRTREVPPVVYFSY